ncbi:MMP21 protein, partial [Amia calva]|nr:MMP21 protein [Amia calva]
TNLYIFQQYLSRYGWVEPVNWESLQYKEDPAPPHILSHVVEGYSTGRTKEQSATTGSDPDPSFNNTLKHFQEANNLPVTGVLDEPTRETMNRPRCGVPDHKVPHEAKDLGVGNSSASKKNTSNSGSSTSHLREKRFLQKLVEYSGKKCRGVVHVQNNLQGMSFSKPTLKWRLLGEGYSAWFPIEEQRRILKRAFRFWSEVIPLNFQEDLSSNANEIDIKLGFGTRRHLGCSQTFDGTGQEFAHAWYLGDIHFDDDEHFVPPKSEQGISLLPVAVHEIGHVLGLTHINRPGSIMQANYNSQNANLELDRKDRDAIQGIYGPCRHSFNTVFDWIYKTKNETGGVTYNFNTYFIRQSWYWMYENRRNRPRTGDPRPLIVGWHGIPSNGIDGYVQIWTREKDTVLFFKGTQYWQYDSENDVAYTKDAQGGTFPKLIKDSFPGVPSPIDTVFFDIRDHNIYFFRGNNVTAFNVDLNSKVDGYPKRIVDVFPPVLPDDHPEGYLDAVYYSYSHKAIYFIKDQEFWKVVDESNRQNNSSLPYNGLLPRRSISSQWLDICDVHPSMLNKDISL